MEKELKIGTEYIVKAKGIVSKIKVLDITKSSILVSFENRTHPQRFLFVDFCNAWVVVEEIENEFIKQLLNQN